MPVLVHFSSAKTRVLNRLCGSKGADVASAETITLGEGGNFFDITGTTGVKYIATTDWRAGSQVMLQFDDVVVVTHNAGTVPANTAAILLAAAGDFTSAAGDTLWLVYDGTTWREVSRTVMS